jgi:hypothetical protein
MAPRPSESFGKPRVVDFRGVESRESYTDSDFAGSGQLLESAHCAEMPNMSDIRDLVQTLFALAFLWAAVYAGAMLIDTRQGGLALVMLLSGAFYYVKSKKHLTR